MFSVYLTLVRLLRALFEAWKDPEFRNVLVLLVMLILTGTVFYAHAEGWSYVDSLYFSVITLATVGYGDLAPTTTIGRLFTIVYIFIGIGLFVAVVHYVAIGLASARRQRVEARKERKAKRARRRPAKKN